MRTYVFSPDGVLLAFGDGQIRVAVDGRVRMYPVATCEVLHARGCGLLGIALDPTYHDTGRIYVFYTTRSGYNRVSRLTIDRKTMIAAGEQVLIDGIPASDTGRNGGAMVFGGDGRLYVATGDAGQPALARSLTSMAGKVLRVWTEAPTCEIWVSGLRDPHSMRFTAEGHLLVYDLAPSGEERIVAATRGGAAA